MQINAVGVGDMGSSPYPPQDPRNVDNPEGFAAMAAQADTPIEVLDALTSHIMRQWEINKRDRTRIEQDFLSAQRAVNTQYDGNTLAAIRALGGSEIYVPLVSMQVNAGVSWLLSVLNPPGDKAFSFKRSPVSELPDSVKQAISSTVETNISEGAPKGPMGEALGPTGQPVSQQDIQGVVKEKSSTALKDINIEATKRAEKMERMVEDQLNRSGWYSTLEDFVSDLCVFPTAFIKTTYEYSTTMAVVKGEDGSLSMEAKQLLSEKDERVSPFDIYPSPDQTCMDNGSLIERLRLSHESIYQCIGIPGYNEENIISVLSDNPEGSQAFQSSVDSERRSQENHTTSLSGDDGAIYGLRFTGPVALSKLVDWGYPVKDLNEQGLLTEKPKNGNLSPIDAVKPIQIDAILVGGKVIKAVPNLDPEGKRPYYMASYRKVPGSFWGKSVAMLSASHGKMVNATARALSNNMGISSGPQVWVNIDMIPNSEAITTIRPLKVWQGVSDPNNKNTKPIEFFQPQSNAKELLGVYQSFFDSVGDVTGIPKAAMMTDSSKQSPAAQTASGMAMLLETSSKQIKQAVRNIDTGVIEARLRQQYKVNMLDPEIPNEFKGDFEIQAIGAKSIVAKAVQNQRSIELLQSTANPMDSKVLGPNGRGKLIKTILNDYDMTDIVPTDDELAQLAKQEQGKEKEPSAEQVKLEIEKMRSETRIKDQQLEDANNQAERQTRLAIAQLEYEAKMAEIQSRSQTSKESQMNEMQRTVVKEKASNARLDAEMVLKEQMGTGI